MDDGLRAAYIRVPMPTGTHSTHPTKMNAATTHINRLRGMGGARHIRHKSGNICRAQPIVVTCMGDGLRATHARVLGPTGTRSTHPTPTTPTPRRKTLQPGAWVAWGARGVDKPEGI
ncbi:hypothetical protein G6F63_014220 [Rhizopus arrhizus]|nr:hypothetical protein G6F63_014220 [Rhizopus arrhizus]